MSLELPNVLPISQAARETGISQRTLYRWVSQGKIEYYSLPSNYKKERKLVTKQNVLDYLEKKGGKVDTD